jgi:uncharacterized membrane protein
MSQVVRYTLYLALSILYALAALTLAYMLDVEAMPYLALGLAVLSTGYTYFLFRLNQTNFSLLAGIALATQALLLVAWGNSGFELPWIVLGLGLLAIMLGNQSIRTSRLIASAVQESGPEEPSFRAVSLRGLLRIVYFVGLVMLVSLIVLVVSLNASIGTLTIPMAGAVILVILVALTLLATTRYRTG